MIRPQHSGIVRGAVRAVVTAAALGASVVPQCAAAQGVPARPIRIAVFNFELEDLTPASALLNATTSSAQALEGATRAAREALESSGRYAAVDAASTTAPAGGWINCDGCETVAAAKIGADQSLLGIVRRATQTDYYVIVEVRDTHTGKLLDQEAANFAGDETGWASGVRMLMKHQVLAAGSPLASSPAADAPSSAAPTAPAPLCKMASVSPVSGFAECIDPPGVPVPPPPPRP